MPIRNHRTTGGRDKEHTSDKRRKRQRPVAGDTHVAWTVAGPAFAVHVVCGPKGVRSVSFLKESRATSKSNPDAERQRRKFLRDHPWAGQLLTELGRYLNGEKASFAGIPLDLGESESFQAKVWRACAKITYGQTVTYAELAARTGRPNAARAVGQAMARNRLPILIPCHRVLRKDGRLGGFSAPGGTSLKRHLLAMEARAARG